MEKTMQEKAEFLFSLLDDIDSVGDVVRTDDKAYREVVERIHKRRYEVASTDGYSIFWDRRKIARPEPVKPDKPPTA